MMPGWEEAARPLAGVILDTIEQVRGLLGAGAADPCLARVTLRSIALSIPCDAGAGPPVLWRPPQPVSLGELLRFLEANDRLVVLDRDRLRDASPDRLSRIELTVHLTD
ncbi:MAG: hypothetical protein IT372_14655 [Polyangiaceae bacterium]|nr:hypothetical protein [Polyangiaceae bacterium]